MKIPSWTWITVIVIACVAILVRNASQASYFRGIADDAHERLEEQEVVLDSVRTHAEELTEALAEAKRANAPETQGIDVEELTRTIRAGIMKDLGRVDTGGSTAASPRGGASSEALSQVDTRKMNPKQLQAHKDALLAAMSKETGAKF